MPAVPGIQPAKGDTLRTWLPLPPTTTGSDSGTGSDFEGNAMSERSTVERPAAAPARNAATSIDNLTFLLGVGAIVAAVVGGSCSTNARIGDVRAEIRDLRAEIQNLRAEFGAEIQNLRAEFGAEIQNLRAEIRDVRVEIRDVRARVEALEDSTAASFATVHRQLAAVAVCMLELRNLVGGEADGGGASTACDSALRAILAPSAPTGL